MTTDQLQQLAGFVVAVVGGVSGNGMIRGRQVQKQTNSHEALQGEIKGLREDLARHSDKMVRLEVRVEATEEADKQVSLDLQNSRVEMHALNGRIDAVTAPITEILQMVKAAKEKNASAAGQKIDEEPPVTGSVTFKEEKKKS